MKHTSSVLHVSSVNLSSLYFLLPTDFLLNSFEFEGQIVTRNTQLTSDSVGSMKRLGQGLDTVRLQQRTALSRSVPCGIVCTRANICQYAHIQVMYAKQLVANGG